MPPHRARSSDHAATYAASLLGITAGQGGGGERGPVAGLHLPLPPPLHPLLDPIVAVQAFYPLAAMLAKARALDSDRPRGLSKVTTTI